MEQYIIVYSKYIITLFMLLYCVLAFCRTFSAGWRGHKLDNIQGILIFLIQFIAFLTICVEKGDVDYLFFYAISQIVIFSSMMIFSMAYTGINRLLVNNMCLLLGTGFIILTRLDIAKAGKQLLIAAASLAVSMVVPLFIRRIRFWKDLTWVYAGVGITALGVVLILGTGYSWLKAVLLFGRDYLPAFGICKNPVSVLHSRHTLGGFLLKKYSYQRSGGSRPRTHPCSVKGSGKRFDFFRGVCIPGVFCNG